MNEADATEAKTKRHNPKSNKATVAAPLLQKVELKNSNAKA